MTSQHTSTLAASFKVGRKFDVAPGVAVPDLTGVAGVGLVRAAQEAHLDVTYFDTTDLRLGMQRIALRHRAGGTDPGWALHLPAGRDREELALDAGSGAVPATLLALVRVHVRDEELVPVASMSIQRLTRQLLGAADEVLAQFVDDTVHGRTLAAGARPEGPELAWREWELELRCDDPVVLSAAQPRLLEAGGLPSSSWSKLERLLPRLDPVAPDPPWCLRPRPAARKSAGAAVQAYLAEQVAELKARDPQTRRDIPDALHKMRVASRRLRSALATFRPLLNRDVTDPVRAELRWLAGVLGAARDAEVMHARLRAMIDAEPDDLVLGKVRERVETLMKQRYGEAHDRVVAGLDSERYLRLLDTLDALAAAPPFTPRAREPATDVLTPLMRRSWRRLERTMAAADRAPRGPRQDALLHQVRKTAKQTRYAAEAVQPVFGRSARRFTAAIARLQETLGDFQDGIVAGAVLLEFGSRGHRAGENSFTFGRLHALEQQRAEGAVRAWPEARAAVGRRRFQRWLQT